MPEERPNFDQLIEDMRAFDQEGQEYMTPVAYAKIRPVYAPYLYGLIKRGKLNATICQCGRKVLNVRETDIYFSRKRPDWPVKPEDDDEEELDEDGDKTANMEPTAEEIQWTDHSGQQMRAYKTEPIRYLGDQEDDPRRSDSRDLEDRRQ